MIKCDKTMEFEIEVAWMFDFFKHLIVARYIINKPLKINFKKFKIYRLLYY